LDSVNSTVHLFPTEVVVNGNTYFTPISKYSGQNTGSGIGNGIGSIASIAKNYVGSRPVYYAHTLPNQGSISTLTTGEDFSSIGDVSKNNFLRANELFNPVLFADSKQEPFRLTGVKPDYEGQFVRQYKQITTPNKVIAPPQRLAGAVGAGKLGVLGKRTTLYPSYGGSALKLSQEQQEDFKDYILEHQKVYPGGQPFVIEKAVGRTVKMNPLEVRKSIRQQQRSASLGFTTGKQQFTFTEKY
jgi:hypothetical protein